ncbi:hypothetical protein BUALT_Bualt10G0096400 [Buddleja alternifolia]|uniref:Cytochrome P450 n=1 Tax=Buddleja alternifolia TaxID=168488 RepID=A0AAV6X400_9LAMI|nr:hypothetical protein BUALT_Bualt10G0096400 [Buddleja alternifolia]
MLSVKVMTYNYTDIAFAPYGDHWRNLRKICILEVLSVRRVQSFRCIREEENYNLAKWIASNEGLPINLSERIFVSAYDVTTRASLERMHQKADWILDSIIDEHRNDDDGASDTTDDLADVLLKYQEDGVELPLTTDNIKSVLWNRMLQREMSSLDHPALQREMSSLDHPALQRHFLWLQHRLHSHSRAIFRAPVRV